ncbi:LysR family transcriptional regulator [Rhodococcoides corynebacterioides]
MTDGVGRPGRARRRVSAATTARVAQPSLPRQLRQLENELGVELFDR